MNTKLIKTKDYLLLVDTDAQIKDRDTVEFLNKVYTVQRINGEYAYLQYAALDKAAPRISYCKKVLAYHRLNNNAPVLEGVPPISLVGFKTRVGVITKTNKYSFCTGENKDGIEMWWKKTALSELLPKQEEHVEQLAIDELSKRYKPHSYVKERMATKSYPLEWNRLLSMFKTGYKAAIQKQFTLSDIEAAFDAGRERINHPDWDYVHESFDDYMKSLSTVTSLPVDFEPEWECKYKGTCTKDRCSTHQCDEHILKLNDAGEVCGTWKY